MSINEISRFHHNKQSKILREKRSPHFYMKYYNVLYMNVALHTPKLRIGLRYNNVSFMIKIFVLADVSKNIYIHNLYYYFFFFLCFGFLPSPACLIFAFNAATLRASFGISFETGFSINIPFIIVRYFAPEPSTFRPCDV